MYVGSTLVYSARWTPSFISTFAWYDAADASTITLNGSNVSQWDDKSGNGHHAVQATASAQPTNAASSFNGNNSLYFDNDEMFVPVIAIPSEEASFYTVYDVNNDTRYAIFGDSQRTHVDLYDGGKTYPNVFRTTRLENLDIGIPSDGPAILGYIVNANTPSYTISLNGTIVFTSVDAFTFSSNLARLGVTHAHLCQFRGNLGEVVMTAGALSTADRQRVEGYLAHKWGLTAKLPAAHPYKSSVPIV